MLSWGSWLAVAGVLLLGAGTALADPIGPDCGSCQGSIYTLTYSGAPIATGGGTETFRITLTIDTSGYSGPGSFLDTVAIKVSSMLKVSSSLVSAPGGVAAWTMVLGGLNAGGCSGSGSGFDCAGAVSTGVGVPMGTPYQWVFDLVMNTGSLFTGAFQSSVKARYVDGNGDKAGALVSEGITLQEDFPPIPEPGALLLFASAAGALWASRPGARRYSM